MKTQGTSHVCFFALRVSASGAVGKAALFQRLEDFHAGRAVGRGNGFQAYAAGRISPNR